MATAEVGVMRELLVEEGDVVKRDQPIAQLNDRLQELGLKIAAKNADLRGRFQSAEAEIRLRRQRLKKLQELQREGHARREEVERAETDLAVSEAQLTALRVDQAVRQLELQQAEFQLKQRCIKSPLDGAVTQVHRRAGEFVAPTEPDVVTIVQLHPLRSMFPVPSAPAKRLRKGMKVRVRVPNGMVNAEIETVSPIVDAGSGTVRVGVRIPNVERKIRSGEPCALILVGDLGASQQAVPPPSPRLRLRPSRK